MYVDSYSGHRERCVRREVHVCIAFGARWIACLMRSGVNQEIWGGGGLKIGLGYGYRRDRQVLTRA